MVDWLVAQFQSMIIVRCPFNDFGLETFVYSVCNPFRYGLLFESRAPQVNVRSRSLARGESPVDVTYRKNGICWYAMHKQFIEHPSNFQ